MKNLKCLFANVYSFRSRFVFANQSEAPVPNKSEKSKGGEKWDIKGGEKWENDPVNRCKGLAGEGLKKCELKSNLLEGRTAEDVRKLGKDAMQKFFLRAEKQDSGRVVYAVDFHGNQDCEKNIGLNDLFGEQTRFLLVKTNLSDEGVLADRGKDGIYYKRDSKEAVKIATGYRLVVPLSGSGRVFGSKF